MTHSDRPSRWAATALAAIAGLGLASAHWLGVPAGAALVSLPQRTPRTGVAAGVAFGILTLVATGGRLVLAGPSAIDAALGMTQLLAVTVAVAVVGGAVGGLARGIVGR